MDDQKGRGRVGGDLVMTISSAPYQVRAIESLHDMSTIIEIPERPSEELTVHAHLSADLPTATDVALVLRHPDLAPHLVLTPRYMFRIDSEGKIDYLGPNEPLEPEEDEP